MKHILQSAKVILLALILSIGISYVSAWTAPTQSPPNGNTSAPLNVSTTPQVKAGGLGVSGLLHGYGTAIFDGNVGLGTTANSAGLKLDVEGNVGAVQYCDNNGANCVASTALGGGGGLGVGQTWQSMNGVKLWGFAYQNTTGKPIEVSFEVTACADGSINGPTGEVSLAAGGPWVFAAGDSSGGVFGASGGSSFVVPDGMYYRLYAGGAICSRNWSELR